MLELDCPPGPVRPDSVLVFVLKTTTLKPRDFNNTSRLFGNWVFVPKEEKLEEYRNQRDIIKERITLAYNAGMIRYGSW